MEFKKLLNAAGATASAITALALNIALAQPTQAFTGTNIAPQALTGTNIAGGSNSIENSTSFGSGGVESILATQPGEKEKIGVYEPPPDIGGPKRTGGSGGRYV